MQEFLSTRTSADINLGAQIALLIGLWIGFYFALRGQITRHSNTMTTMVLSQLFLIFFVMGWSFYNFVISGRHTTGTVATLMMVHGFFGVLTEASGIYLILRMRTQIIPRRLRVRNYKLVMRSTLALWTIVAVVGFAIYYERYLESEDVIVAAPLDQLHQAGEDLVIHAAELRGAIARGDLEASRRHAEHLVNLIEGQGGENYGDLDENGHIEDPGDGTGLLIYLRDVERVVVEVERAVVVEDILGVARMARAEASEIISGGLSVLRAGQLSSVEAVGNNTFSLADSVKKELIQIEDGAKQAGITALKVTIPIVPGVKREPNTVTVFLDQIQFINKTVTIEPGWTIFWVDAESPRHTVTADDDAFDSGTLSKGDTFSVTFDQVGEFPYYCRFHGDRGHVGMAGKIIVK